MDVAHILVPHPKSILSPRGEEDVGIIARHDKESERQPD